MSNYYLAKYYLYEGRLELAREYLKKTRRDATVATAIQEEADQDSAPARGVGKAVGTPSATAYLSLAMNLLAKYAGYIRSTAGPLPYSIITKGVFLQFPTFSAVDYQMFSGHHPPKLQVRLTEPQLRLYHVGNFAEPCPR